MAHRLLKLSWLRTLVWLLALALPLQVQAQVGMLGCGQATHQQHQQMQHDDASAEHQHHEAGKAASPHQCSACAACCVGAALQPGAAHAPGGPAGHAVLQGATEPASLDVVAATPKRPPRAAIA